MSEYDFTGERLTTTKRSEIMIHHLHRYAMAIDLARGKVVLDIASGEGYGSNLLAKVAESVLGVDIEKKVVDFANQKYTQPNLEFKVGSTSLIPSKDNVFDLIVSFETIEHHDEHEQMMEEFKRVLKPGGVLIISSPDKLNYTDIPQYTNSFHVKELYKEEFKTIIARYFAYARHFNQNLFYSSIIVSDNGDASKFKEFNGDFDKIIENETLSIPMYNICVASDEPIENENFADASIFNAQEVFNDIKNKEAEIYASKTYKIGKFFTFPIRLIRSLRN
ncbi:MAG: class I SAM-dependent methyltransferase [Fluviicola sp.]|jgi:ubiquinone/menaquinone biosynthesis C-methylase UbiE